MSLDTTVIPPGSTIGILGDGQLGRMLAHAGQTLGYTIATLGPGGRNSPAGQVARHALSWGDDPATLDDRVLQKFCSLVSVVLVEWENVPLGLIQRIEKYGTPVRSSARALGVAQDRSREKATATRLNIPTPRYHLIITSDSLRYARTTVPGPAIMKTMRGGYDGKGQVRISADDDIASAWDSLGRVPCILEEQISFAAEISVIIACSARESVIYGPFENVHTGGILRTTHFPAGVSASVSRLAKEYTRCIADHLGVHGLLAVEFFVTNDGRVVFNEMAPRPHNSGHLTIECHTTSQFAQYILAACNRRLGDATPLCRGDMQNLIGDDILPYIQGVHVTHDRAVHLYGKEEARPGRKMGHTTRRIPFVA